MNIASYKEEESSSESENEISSVKMEPPSDTHDKMGDSVIINMLWFFFEMLTILKDFYNVSLKPAFNTITNGYFKTRVVAMYKNTKDIHAYSTVNEFLYDQYFHIPYKFVIITEESENGLNAKYVIKSDGEEITSTMVDRKKKLSQASILVLRAYLPNREDSFDIHLKLPDNYMVVDNVFNHYFIAWYLLNNYSISCTESDLLQTKLEFMTSSFKMESVEAPYQIKINENLVEIYETHDIYTDTDTDTYTDNPTECCSEKEDIDIGTDLDEESEDEVQESPTFTFHQQNDTSQENIDDILDTSSISVNRSNSEEENIEENISVHFTFEEEQKEAENEKITKTRRGRKKKSANQDTCTCGVCGEEYHISELTDCLLCEHCS
jgi:hypothetical protein